MDGEDLEKLIAGVETRSNGRFRSVQKCIDDINSRLEKVKEYQYSCSVAKKLEEFDGIIYDRVEILEGKINIMKGRMFWNSILVSLFLSCVGFLVGLHLLGGEEIKPKDVQQDVKKLEQSIEEMHRKLDSIR